MLRKSGFFCSFGGYSFEQGPSLQLCESEPFLDRFATGLAGFRRSFLNNVRASVTPMCVYICLDPTRVLLRQKHYGGPGAEGGDPTALDKFPNLHQPPANSRMADGRWRI